MLIEEEEEKQKYQAMDIEYEQLLLEDLNSTTTQQKIQSMLKRQETRYNVDIDDIRAQDANLAKYIINNPSKVIRFLEQHLRSTVDELTMGETGSKERKKQQVNLKKNEEYKIGITGNLGKNHVNPRGLTSKKINSLLEVKGIVTRLSILRPKLVKSVHYCEETKLGSVRDYFDEYNLAEENNITLTKGFPTKDHQGNCLSTEFGYCLFRDIQTLILQEMPERAPTGLLPRSIEVVIMQDLVDKVKPGDRIKVVGVFKSIVTPKTKHSGIFKQMFIATNIEVIHKEEIFIQLSMEDIKQMQQVAKRNKLMETMASSIGPSIQGHLNIKKGILLMLIGGEEKNLENGTHLRGDVNILMVGDPGTAKSQLLRAVMNLRPGTINTTGRGSTGVGLTAAVVYDRDTGLRNLEAGAMVLGDRGIVCIDEFDKMNEVDRVAIHEVMEQQTVTIAKAGIHATLNARCSVIAAANPIYGEYQIDISPSKNISLPDSLLSRFDLIFVVLDQKDEEKDRIIATRVIKNHRYKNENWDEMLNEMNETYDEPSLKESTTEEELVYLKYNSLTHLSKKQDIFTRKFLQKYIHYAKSQKPKLTKKVSELISKSWAKLRNEEYEDYHKGVHKAMPVTIRTLETLIRLATAHAKLRLSKTVQEQDCNVAFELLYKSLYQENETTEESSEMETESIDESKSTSKTPSKTPTKTYSQSSRTLKKPRTCSKRSSSKKTSPKVKESLKSTPRRSKRLSKIGVKTDKQISETESLSIKQQKYSITKSTKTATKSQEAEEAMEKFIVGKERITGENVKFTYKIMNKYFETENKNYVTVNELWEYVQKKGKKSEKGYVMSKNKMKRSLMDLEDKGKIMISDSDVIYPM